MKLMNILMTQKNLVGRSGLHGLSTAIIMLSLFFPSFAYSGSGVFGERDDGMAPAAWPTKIYVADFEIEAGDIESDPGLLQRQRERRGLLGDVLPRPLAQKDPEVQARELVDLMSYSLVKELADRGLNARRISPGETPPEGLLVRGVFTHIDEGNRLRRAVIGFGAGETDLQVVVSVDDLSQGWPKPLYELSDGAQSRKMPGAIITLNPYAAAAKYVLSKNDLERSVKRAASKIAAEIATRVGR